jgi:hypothetical protein
LLAEMVKVMKTVSKKAAWVRVTDPEINLINTWRKEGVPMKTIADRLGRPKKTIYAHMGSKGKKKPLQGRPPIIKQEQKNVLRWP